MVANVDFVTCEVHNKRGYYTRKDANRAARAHHPGEHLDAYPCDRGTGLWHIGHLPPVVLKSGVPRAVATKKRRRA